jgi:FixJ family two-component response regulator
MDFPVIDDDKTFRDATCFLIEEAGHYAEGVERYFCPRAAF